ncbi:SRPBCC family protein [soil metagenome]
MTTARHVPNPALDLVLERDIDVPRDLVWAAWTTPEHIMQWFVPAPWTMAAYEVDLRPGGRFKTVMRSPEGQEFPSDGCYLEVVPQQRLVFNHTLLPGYRPAPEPFFTAIIEMHDSGAGTRYVATAMHRDPEGRDRHEGMGFFDGWGTALDQLVAHTKTLRKTT